MKTIVELAQTMEAFLLEISKPERKSEFKGKDLEIEAAQFIAEFAYSDALSMEEVIQTGRQLYVLGLLKGQFLGMRDSRAMTPVPEKPRDIPTVPLSSREQLNEGLETP